MYLNFAKESKINVNKVATLQFMVHFRKIRISTNPVQIHTISINCLVKNMVQNYCY